MGVAHSYCHELLMVTVHIEGKPLQMEIDTGACVSMVNHKVYNKLSAKKLNPSQAKLKGYAGRSIKQISEAEVTVCHIGQQATLPLVVVKGDSPSLLGRNWLDALRLDWKENHLVGSMDLLRSLLDKCTEVFKEGLGELKGHEAKIHVQTERRNQNFARPTRFHMQ